MQVLLIEDDTDFAQTLADYLAMEHIHCDYACDGEQGMALLAAGDYQVILLDINMPLKDGMAVCAELRQQGNTTPVIMLTARDSLDDKLAGFGAGTDDYLVKPFALEEMVARVRALSNRVSGNVSVLTTGGLQMDLTRRQLSRNGKTIELGPISWKILETLLRNGSKVTSKRELEATIWPDDIPESEALKVHLFHLRQRVDKPFAYPLIHTVPGQGYVIRDEAP